MPCHNWGRTLSSVLQKEEKTLNWGYTKGNKNGYSGKVDTEKRKKPLQSVI